MNSELKNNTFKVPDELLGKLKSSLASFSGQENSRGVKRAKDILANPNISYAQIKRLKNYFDTYEGVGTDTEYKLIGGDEMKNWVNSSLKTSRDSIYNVKNTRMMAGEENQFIDSHEKDFDNANPTGINIPKINKMSKAKYIMLDRSFTEEISRIKQLIDHMSK
jgi:hypothetical protein